MQKSYEYYADGSLKYVQDQINPVFDRFNKYDFAGRITEGKSGAEARGLTVAQNDMSAQLPYRQSYQYDAFSNLTQRNNLHWGVDNWYGQSNDLSYSYQNNRIAGYTYDADGRTLITSYPDEYSEATYEATGQLIRLHNPSQSDIYRTYDGSGREVKRRKFRWQDNPYSPSSPYGQWVDEGAKYFIRSSILGNETISEVDNQGKKIKSFVKAAGATIATQNVIGSNTKTVNFEHFDASGMSYKTTDSTGNVAGYSGTDFSPGELDPMGGNMGTETPYVEPLNPEPLSPEINNNFMLYEETPNYVNGQRQTCAMDGMAVPCSMARQAMENGSAATEFMHNGRYYQAPIVNYGAGLFGITVGISISGRVRTDGNAAVMDISKVRIDTRMFSFPANSFPYFKVVKEGNVNYLAYKDVQSARDMLQNAYDEKCKNAMAKLINVMSSVTRKDGTKGDPITTNLLDLFDKIQGQKTGGFFLNAGKTHEVLQIAVNAWSDAVKLPREKIPCCRNDGAVAIRPGTTNDAHIYTAILFNKAETPQKMLTNLIHELLHVAAKRGTYDHDTYLPDPAFGTKVRDAMGLTKTDPNDNQEAINNYIKENCKIR